MDTIDTATQLAYLQRIGITGRPTTADEVTLRTLHRSHLLAVPFENLDIHIGRPIVLDLDRIVAKIVEQRRGGFCYELNGAFAALLRSLGFEVTMLEARVHTEGGLGIRFDHLCLRVDLDRPFLVDVGFGDLTMEPISLTTDEEQLVSGHRFRFEHPSEAAEAGDAIGTAPVDGWLDLIRDDERQYRFVAHPGPLAEFEPGCHFHQSSPDSHFTRNLVCSLPTGDRGRVTISGRQLTETDPGNDQAEAVDNPVEAVHKRTLETDEIGPILETRFGVSLGQAEIDRLVSGLSTT